MVDEKQNTIYDRQHGPRRGQTVDWYNLIYSSHKFNWLLFVFRACMFHLPGGLSAALDGDLLKEHGITHVVTVDIKPLPPNGYLQHLFVPGIRKSFNFWIHWILFLFCCPDLAHDVASQDLLASFESVFEFVETGKDCGGVLVHWSATFPESFPISPFCD